MSRSKPTAFSARELRAESALLGYRSAMLKGEADPSWEWPAVGGHEDQERFDLLSSCQALRGFVSPHALLRLERFDLYRFTECRDESPNRMLLPVERRHQFFQRGSVSAGDQAEKDFLLAASFRALAS